MKNKDAGSQQSNPCKEKPKCRHDGKKLGKCCRHTHGNPRLPFTDEGRAPTKEIQPGLEITAGGMEENRPIGETSDGAYGLSLGEFLARERILDADDDYELEQREAAEQAEARLQDLGE